MIEELKPQAPPNNLPTWGECSLRVDNSDYIARRAAEGGYGPEADSKLATQLHRFIFEYDDADPYRSWWFMHRLELVLDEQAQEAAQELNQLRAEVERLRAHYELAVGVLQKIAAKEGSINYTLDDVLFDLDDAISIAKQALAELGGGGEVSEELKPPECWNFAMDFLGDPQASEISEYVQRLRVEVIRLRVAIERAGQRAEGWPDSNDDPAEALADCARILYEAIDGGLQDEGHQK